VTPLFSIITPVYEPPRRGFEECIGSVLGQTFGDWEWCLAEDRSPSGWVRERLQALEARENRVRVALRDSNGGIVAATNDALALATGTFLVLLDNDDELEPDALQVMAELVAVEPEIDYAYSDELVWSVGIDRYVRLWKPAWSPERMRSQNYANHLSIFRRSLVTEIGGYREGFDGAQDHDLVLRVGERARVIRHVPRSLYRWKVAPGSTVASPETKLYAFDAGIRAVQEHCDRVGIDATVDHGPSPGVYRVRRRVQGHPLVSVVIPSNAPVATIRGEERSLLEGVVADLVERTDYANVEVLVVPDPQTDRERLDAARRLDPDRVRIADPIPRPFNFSRKSNVGAALSRGEYLLFLNDDVEVHDPDWLSVLLAIAQDPEVGAVGPKLLFEDGSIQHAGVFAWHGPGHVGFGAPSTDAGHMGMYEVDREVVATTGACLLSSRVAFEQVGGFSLALPSNWNDVDYCFKLRASGYRIVWSAQATLTHFESVTREVHVEHAHRLALWGRWARELVNDPYFTPAIASGGYSWPMEPYR
jgi:GT2 family glycosyltransferase